MNLSADPASGCRRWQGKIWRACRLTALLALGGTVAHGQNATPPGGGVRGDYRPNNVFAYPAKLSLDFRRVAVLPLAAGVDSSDLADGCNALAPILRDELIKTKRFEVVAVDPTALRRSTGRVAWTGTEALPADFLGFLRREYDCDAVLFAELTSYRAYAPLAVGWRLKLVDVRSGQILWAVDELFDAADPAVYHASQKFAGQPTRWPFCHQENWLAANSPRLFGRYAAAALVDRLPER